MKINSKLININLQLGHTFLNRHVCFVQCTSINAQKYLTSGFFKIRLQVLLNLEIYV